MRVALLNDSFPPIIDGVANVVLNYAKILTEQLDTQVIVGTPRYPKAEYTGYPYPVVAYPSVDTSKLVAGYRAGDFVHWPKIRELIDFQPDIIHTHCPAASALVARIVQNHTGAPVVFTYHTKFDVDIERAVGDGLWKKQFIKMMIDNISACDEVWVVSKGAGENLKSLGFQGDYRVVDNGVDFAKGRVEDALVKEVTGRFDLPEGVPVFLFVGRMMKYKGLPIIVDALGELSQKGVDFRMVFVGGGADAKEMQESVKAFGISTDIVGEDGTVTHTDGAADKSGRVIFAGAEHDRDRLRAWNTRADLFLFPSVYDTNGIVVREAAACGLASILIKDSCAAEGVTDGRNGFLIEENAQSMAQMLMALAPDLEKLHTAGQYAMDEIYISWEDSVREAYRRYEEILLAKQDGTLAEKKKRSLDYLMQGALTVSKGTNQVITMPRTVYESMCDNFRDVIEGIASLGKADE